MVEKSVLSKVVQPVVKTRFPATVFVRGLSNKESKQFQFHCQEHVL